MKPRLSRFSSPRFSAQFHRVTIRLAAALLVVFGFLSVFSTKALAQNPVPFVNQPLVPDAAAPGGPDFTLTVNGTGFVLGSVVNWNGGALATHLVNGSQLTATVPAGDIATTSTASVTVVNPAPGGGTSNVVLFPVTTPTASVTFRPPFSVTTATFLEFSPASVAMGDFNGDGKADLVVPSYGSEGVVKVLLSNGDGTFQAPVEYGTGPLAVIAVGADDVNGDGKLDLIAIGCCETVSVLLGNGDGTFQSYISSPTGGANAFATGDFNGDGKLDLAVAIVSPFGPSGGTNTVSILLGNGDGTFQAPVAYTTGTAPTSLAVGDFNGDGRLDLAVTNRGYFDRYDPSTFQPSSISILLGNGDGTFQPHVDYLIKTGDDGPTGLIAADFNGDGKLDLAFADYGLSDFSGGFHASDAVVSVWLGRGDGTFQPGVDYATGTGPLSVAAGDFNGDGKVDLAVTNSGDNTVSILLGDGTGKFTLASSPAVGTFPDLVAVGDFDSNGKLDLLVANVPAGDLTVSILLQGTTVTVSPTSLSFGPQVTFTASGPQTVTVSNTGNLPLTITGLVTSGDFAQTNTCDEPVAIGASCTISVTFTPTSLGTIIGSIAITDNAAASPQTVSLTGTGLIAGGVVTLWPTSLAFPNQPIHTTSAAQTVTLTNPGGAALGVTNIVASGDFIETNTCGNSVPAGTSCTISVTFTPTQGGTTTGSVTVTDNASGSPQSVLLTGSTKTLAQNPVPFINQPLVPDATPPGGPQFTLTVNGTGFVSGSVVNWNGSALATQFVSSSKLTATVPAAKISTASTASLTVINPAPGGGTSSVAFLMVTANVSSVAFGLASSVSTPSAEGVAVGDFNGDGKLDMAVVNHCGTDPSCNSTGTVSILLGDGMGNFTVASSPAVGSFPTSVVVGDFNGDGKLDLAVVNQCGTDPNCNSTGTVSILLGDGMGNFTVASSPAVGSFPTSVVVGDFNGDGKLDLAVANYYANTVSILLGDGTGNLTLASSPATGVTPNSVAVGDFNGDGKLDLAVANLCGTSTSCAGFPGTVSILLGDGTGNFTSGSTLATGGTPSSVVVGDFNGDGKLDLAVATNSSLSRGVSILLGDGKGNFTLASSPFPYTPSPSSVAEGDFNGDGKLDLAVGGSGGYVSILLGVGDGSFGSPLTLKSGNYALAVGDFNGDGKPDLVVTDLYFGTVSILLQPSPAVALSPTSLSFGTQSSGPQVVSLTNTGSDSLSVTSIVAGGDFAETNTCGGSVAAGASCTISVTFTPTASGTRTGAISITDNAPGSPQIVSLTGTATGPVATLSAATISLGGQVVGTTSAAHTVTLTNSGNAALSITSIAITNGFRESNTCGATLAAGASCTITVTFTPSSAARIAGTLSITDNALGSPQQVSLSGTGQDFSIGFRRTTETVTAGETAVYDLLIRPLGGFNQTVALTCEGAPQFGDCVVSPASIAPANGAVAVSVKVTTKAPSQTLSSGAAGRRWPPVGPSRGPWLWLLALSAVILALVVRRRGLVLVSALIPLSVATWVACGSETALFLVSTPGTPAGTSTITVNATSGPLTHTATTILVVR